LYYELYSLYVVDVYQKEYLDIVVIKHIKEAYTVTDAKKSDKS